MLQWLSCSPSHCLMFLMQVAAVREELPELLRCSFMQYQENATADASLPQPAGGEAAPEPQLPQ